MAKIKFIGLDVYAGLLEDLGENIESLCKYAIYPGAGLLLDEIKKNTPVGKGGVYFGEEYPGGELQDSCYLTHMKMKDGVIYTKIDWADYDFKWTPNRLKAAVLEHGRSNRSKVPFIRPAVNRVKAKAIEAMSKAFNEKLTELINSK